MCLYAYGLAAASLIALSRGRVTAVAAAVVAILAILALVASAQPVELGLSLLPVAAASLLYLWLRRR